MKKSLLSGLLAFAATLSSFAMSNGDYVYTRDAAFRINSEPETVALASGLSGWTAISATEGNTVDKIFTVNEGVINQTTTSNSKEGMYYKFAPKANATVVSFQIRQLTGVKPYTTNISYGQAFDAARGCYGMDAVTGFNYVNLIANANGFTSTDDFKSCGTEILLTPDWQTVYFAAQDVAGLDLYLVISGMHNGVEIKDIQIASGIEMADMRQVEMLKSRVKSLVDSREDWAEDEFMAPLVEEMLPALEAVNEATTVSDFASIAESIEGTLEEVFANSMEDYLSAQTAKTDFSSFGSKTQKVSAFGDWKAVTSGGRWFKLDGCAYAAAIHAPHFGGVDGFYREAVTMEMTKTLSPGTYYFQLDGCEWVMYNGTPYTGAKKNYMRNLGLSKGEMTVYFKKDGEVVASNTVKTPASDPTADYFKANTAGVALTIKEAGEYVIGFSSTCPFTDEEISYYGIPFNDQGIAKGFNYGGSFAYNNPKLYCKLDGRSAACQAYIDAVKQQIKAGRENYDKAIESQNNAEMVWGKTLLKECTDSMLVKLQGYEALTEEDIEATYDKDVYEPGATSENGLLEHEVYVEVARDLIAANKKFTAVNDTLNSLAAAIKTAETTRAARVYSGSTDTAFDGVIAEAKSLNEAMLATEYSEENAAAIVNENKKLSEAADVFKAAAAATKTFVDIDFENKAVNNEGVYSISGAVGSMTFSDFIVRETADDKKTYPFEQGFQSTAEQNDSTGLLRVGKGIGTVEFNAVPEKATDIIKVSFDYYFGALTKGYCGFYIYGEDGNSVADYYACKYDGAYTSNPMGIDLGKYNHVGSSSASNSAIAAASNCTHFEIFIDYGRKSIICNYGTNGAVNITEEIALTNESPITRFEVKSGYTNSDRRCFFDNLKIVNVPAPECEPFDAVKGVSEVNAAAAPAAVKFVKNGTVLIKTANGTVNAAGAQVK